MFKIVIPSEANHRGARMVGHARMVCGVEESLEVHRAGKLHEIPRLRNSPFGRIAPLGMTDRKN